MQWYRETRVRWIGLVIVAVLAGVGLEMAMDPVEDDNLAWIGLVVGSLVIGAIGAYWQRRFVRPLSEPDERRQAIELRSSRVALFALVGQLSGIVVLTAAEVYSGAIWPLLVGAMAVSLFAQEAAVEYYRRRM